MELKVEVKPLSSSDYHGYRSTNVGRKYFNIVQRYMTGIWCKHFKFIFLQTKVSFIVPLFKLFLFLEHTNMVKYLKKPPELVIAPLSSVRFISSDCYMERGLIQFGNL